MDEKKIIIETNPSKNSEIHSIFTEKKLKTGDDGVVLIVGSGRSASQMADLHQLITRLNNELKMVKVAMHNMGEAGIRANKAGTDLSSTLRKCKMPLICPDEMIMDPNLMPDMDFSHLEKIVIDSISKINDPFLTKFAEVFYDEAGPISKKAYKKLKQLAKKRQRQPKNLEEIPQKEIWANSWNHKIKRKL